MNYQLDTNIISEIRKGGDCNPHVAVWYDAVDEDSIYVSVLVLGEMRARPILPKPARLSIGSLR